MVSHSQTSAALDAPCDLDVNDGKAIDILMPFALSSRCFSAAPHPLAVCRLPCPAVFLAVLFPTGARCCWRRCEAQSKGWVRTNGAMPLILPSWAERRPCGTKPRTNSPCARSDGGRTGGLSELDARNLYNIIRNFYEPSSLPSQTADLDCPVRAKSLARASGVEEVRQPLTNTEGQQIWDNSFFNHIHDS